MRIVTAALISIAMLLPATSRAEGSGEACDRLAADSVAIETIDAEGAVAACAAALEDQPGEARFAYQYARALERAGRLGEARRLYGWASDDGYGPAAAALRRLGASEVPAPPDADVGTAAMLGGLSAVLDRYAAELPADPADPLAALAAIGRDPAAILDWVAGNTRLVAYRGALRGSSGVLLDRAGNSLDRALLLASLLRRAGQQVRLARATLDEAKARSLLPATAREAPVPLPPPLALETAAALFDADPRLDPAMVRTAALAAQRDAETVSAAFAARRALVLPALTALVGDLASEADRSAEAESVAALAEHYWVQLRTGEGWRDLDPDGAALGPLVPDDTFSPDEMPAALWQTVTLRVILELQDTAGRREETLLDWQGRPAELIDRPILFTHVPRLLGAMDPGPLLDTPGRLPRMLDALDRETAWLPVLQVGADAVVDRLFTRDGAIAAADSGAFAGTGRAIDGMFGAVGAALGEAEAAPVDVAIPTAEWLEIEVLVPGAEPRVERRTIFDLVGSGARAAGTIIAPTAEQLRERAARLLGQTQILIAGAAPTELQAARFASRDLAALAERLFDVRTAPAPLDLAALDVTPPPPLLLTTFASRRLGAGEGAPVAASPTVLLQHIRLGSGPGDTLRTTIELDIVRNEVAIAAARGSFLRRLEQGVADTILEALPFEGIPGARNAATFHAEDLAAGRPWATLDPARLPEVPADARALIEADLQRGLVVVAPADLAGAAAAGRLAWWRIDPRTGTTLGMLDDGAGAAMIEYQELLDALVPAGCAFFMVGALAGGGGQTTALAASAVCAVGGLGLGMLETVAIPGLFLGSGIGVSSIAWYLLRQAI